MLAKQLTERRLLAVQLLTFLIIAAFPLIAFIRLEWAWALLIFPVVWIAHRWLTGLFFPKTPLKVGILGIALMTLVSLYATYDIAFSFLKIAGILYGVTLFFLLVSASETESSYLLLVALYLGLGLGIAGISLVTINWRSRLPIMREVASRLPGSLIELPGLSTAINPNEVAGIMMWLSPFAITLTIAAFLWLVQHRSEKGVKRAPIAVAIGSGLAAITFTLVLGLTDSRGGFLGFGAALILTPLIAAWDKNWKITLVLAAILSALTLFLLFGQDRISVGQALFPGSNGLEGGFDEIKGVEGRIEIWSRAIYGIQDFSFTGMGVGTFREVVHILYPLFTIAPSTDIAHAHNLWLQMGLDLGVPGLIAYLSLWLGVGFMLIQIWRGSESYWHKSLAVAFSSALIAYFSYGIFDTITIGARPGFLFWMLLGLIAGLYRLTAERSIQSAQ